MNIKPAAFITILTLILITLRLCNVITWPWVWVLVPFWGFWLLILLGGVWFFWQQLKGK